MEESPLRAIGTLLEEEGYPSYCMEVGEDNPIERLFVSLSEVDEPERVLELSFATDMFDAAGLDEDPLDAVLLQFFVRLQGTARPELLGETARAALLLNRIVPAGGFGMTDPEGALYLQYSLGLSDRVVPRDLLLDLVAMAAFFSEDLGRRLCAVAAGQLTVSALREELDRQGIELPELFSHPTTTRDRWA